LVPSRRFGVTIGAGALHIPIGQEAPTVGAIGLEHATLINIALFEKGEEDIMSDLGMVQGAGAGEEVE